ncbi:MAG TPA: class I mannose-6-phosphate isomerase [Conexibacter sp.]
MRSGVRTAAVPHRLDDNRIPPLYGGGARIDAFRVSAGPVCGPEDWVGSVWELPTYFAAAGRDDWGLSRLPDGQYLRDAIAADAEGWLGAPLAAAAGGTPGVLVKLLDAGERLPVHFHPTRPFARRHLGSAYGKTEGWAIIDAEPGAAAWLGFRNDVSLETLREWVATQNSDAMLAAMNRHDVSAGDAIYVPAGVPHAFGPGILLCELQEPTSFSIHMEHVSYGMDDDVATLGLGWETALEGVELRAMADEVDGMWSAAWEAHSGPGGRADHLFPREALPFFDAQRVAVRGKLELLPSFGVLVVLRGEGRLLVQDGEHDMVAGETWIVPHGAGPVQLAGELDALLCLPPLVQGAAT